MINTFRVDSPAENTENQVHNEEGPEHDHRHEIDELP